MKNILVTGDSGYIGSVLVSLLIKDGYKVVGYDTDFFVTSKKNYKHSNYERIRKDIRDISEEDIKGTDVVIHLSALSNDPMGELSPELTDKINAESSLRLAEICKKAGVKRFLFSSSCSIYGIAKSDVVDENSQINPLTSYARSKIKVEDGLKKLADKNFCVGLLRNSTVYGYSSRFRNDLVVNNLVTSALAYKKIKVMSDGSPWRPLIDVRDLSNIFIEFIKIKPEKVNGNVINIGFNENNFRVKDIVDIIKKHMPDCDIVYTGEHGADSRSYKVNFDKFKKIFPNYKQEWCLDKSVQDLICNLKKIRFSAKDFDMGKYARLNTLRQLINNKKLNDSLYWKIK